MTAVADLISPAERARLAGLMRQLGALAWLMREPPRPGRGGGQDDANLPAPGGAAQKGTT